MKHLLKPLFLVLTLLCVSIGISAQEANPDDLYQLSNEGKTLTITPGTDLADVMTSLGDQNQEVTELYITGAYLSTESINALKTDYFPNLTKVNLTLSDDVTAIPDDAYKGCQILKTLHIPASVTNIGSNALATEKVFYGNIMTNSDCVIYNDEGNNLSARAYTYVNNGRLVCEAKTNAKDSNREKYKFQIKYYNDHFVLYHVQSNSYLAGSSQSSSVGAPMTSNIEAAAPISYKGNTIYDTSRNNYINQLYGQSNMGWWSGGRCDFLSYNEAFNIKNVAQPSLTILPESATPASATDLGCKDIANVKVPFANLDAYRAADGWKDCSINSIEGYVEDITANVEHVFLIPNLSFDILPSLIPSYSESRLLYSSSDQSVATVDADGKVTAVGAGSAFINITADDELQYTKQIPVSVLENANVLKDISQKDLETLVACLGEKCSDVTELYITGNYPDNASLDNLKSSYFPNLEKVHLTLETTATSIGYEAYKNCNLLSSIEIPSCVTSIGKYAFYQCSSLTSVGDLSACQSIGGYAFRDCSSLTSVGDLSACQSIGDYAFRDCSSLVSIDLSSCTSIGSWAFYQCSSLTSVDLSACQSIGGYAFYRCYSQTSVDLSACQSIGEHAFYNCSRLTSVGDLSVCQSIGGSVFFGCSSLTSVGDLPLCQSIGSSAFRDCTSLTFVGDLPACQSIGEYAFYECSSLTSVGDLPACQSIGYRAFVYCTSLNFIGDLSACQSIGSDAFWDCPFKIILNPENFNKWITNDYITNYLRSREKQFKGTDTEGYDLVLTEDITAIPDYALQNCQGLRSITATAPISSIGVNAFANCKDLITVTFNDVKSIGENAFPNMTYNPCKITIYANEPATLAAVNCFNNVCLIYVPATTLDAYHAAEYWQSHASQIIAIGCQENYDVNVTADSNMSSLHVAIGENNLSSVVSLKVTGTINSYDLMLMRNKMTNLKSLDLTDARIVTNPYEYYQGFSSVTDVLTRHSMPDNVFTLALPTSIKQINSYALSDFTNLRKLQIPASVETMEANVANGNAVTDIYFTEGSQLTSLGDYAFQDCKGIVDPKLEYTSIPTIGNNTFDGCSNMGSISIPASAKTIKEGAFKGCGNLAELNVIDSEEELSVERRQSSSAQAFYDCGKLTSLYLGRNIKGVNNNPFSGRGSLKNVEIGSNVTALADNLFEYCTGIEELTGDMSNIETIGKRAFYWCSKLSEFTFNSKVTTIPEYAFYGCSALKSVSIPENVTDIQQYAFKGCTALEAINLPVNITTLGQHTFDGCTAATECVIPANSQISTIPTYCFANCTSLKKVNLPVSVKEIEDYAFYNCTGMEEVKISSAVNHVGDYAFNGCTKLFDVYTYTIEPQAINQNTFSQFSGATLHVPAVSWYNYYYDTQWSQFLKMVNFDVPYDYVFVEKDFTLRTDQLGTIKGNPQFDIWGGGALIIAGNLLQMAKDCYLGFKNGKWGSIIPSCGNFKPQTLYVNIDVNKDFWYAFSFPFDVDLTKVKKEGDYVFRRYDGAMRAENGSGGWQPVTGNTLKANTGYIFRTNVAGTLSIPITAPQFSTIDKIIDILTHPSSIGAEHAGWNFIGNPFTAYYSMNDMNYEAPVMVWNGTTYEAYRPGDDDHVFHPFEAFFVQRPSNKSCVSFKMNNRMSCNESEAMLASNAKKASSTFATTANAKRKLINLTLSDGTMTDKCRVVYNDEQFMGYDADCDAAKFVSSENVPQIYTIDDNGTKYAINERPMQDSKVMLGYVANAEGEYTIAAPRMDAKVVIFDREKNVLHDFADGGYTFETVAGTNNTRFAIYSTSMIPTGIKEIAGVADDDAESDGNAYDLGGRKVENSAKGVIIKNGMKQVVK